MQNSFFADSVGPGQHQRGSCPRAAAWWVTLRIGSTRRPGLQQRHAWGRRTLATAHAKAAPCSGPFTNGFGRHGPAHVAHDEGCVRREHEGSAAGVHPARPDRATAIWWSWAPTSNHIEQDLQRPASFGMSGTGALWLGLPGRGPSAHDSPAQNSLRALRGGKPKPGVLLRVPPPRRPAGTPVDSFTPTSRHSQMHPPESEPELLDRLSTEYQGVHQVFSNWRRNTSKQQEYIIHICRFWLFYHAEKPGILPYPVDPAAGTSVLDQGVLSSNGRKTGNGSMAASLSTDRAGFTECKRHRSHPPAVVEHGRKVKTRPIPSQAHGQVADVARQHVLPVCGSHRNFQAGQILLRAMRRLGPLPNDVDEFESTGVSSWVKKRRP